MQQHVQQNAKLEKQRKFTASDLAEFEYCPLAWWYEEYEPHTREEDDELFARMVELEHEHGQQATVIPEYQVIEQLLLRRGAFATGRQQHRAHAEEVEQAEKEPVVVTGRAAKRTRALITVAVIVLLLALALLALAMLGSTVFLR